MLTESCFDLSGKIRAIDRKGEKVTAPGSTTNPEEFYPTEYDLKFSRLLGQCMVKIDDSVGGGEKDRFIVSNLFRRALKGRPFPSDIVAAFYGGIGNLIEIEINGARKELPIEPVGIILIGIDALRQDVLYPDKKDGKDFENVNDPDPYGNYYVDARNLNGLGQILLGDPTDSSTQQYIMLPEVTAIFPSVTLPSWASIFTGKLPNETAIPGNEFFARDLINYNSSARRYEWKSIIPSMGKNPAGVITLLEGAFPRGTWDFQRLTPFSKRWEDSPQNNKEVLKPSTLHELLKENSAFKKYFADKGGKSDVGVFHLYSRGAREWVTLDESAVNFLISKSYALDEIPGDNAEQWLTKNLLVKGGGQRNNIPFPGLFIVYFAGLDKEAHVAGMGEYRNFFKSTTDDEIKDIVSWLKRYGEFDNKIFIIVSDHGMTEMPDSSQMTYVQVKRDGDGNIVGQKTWYGDTSCELKVENFNKEKVLFPELANNNLHIWELATVLSKLEEKMDYGLWSKDDGLFKEHLRVLTPKEIAAVFKDTTGVVAEIEKANIIAAFNGPMAHIYVRGNDGWKDLPDPVNVDNVAEVFRLFMQVNNSKEAEEKFKLSLEDYHEIRATLPRLKLSLDTILIRQNGGYKVFNGIGYPATDLAGSEYVEASKRIRKLNHENRSGDIVLIFKDYTHGGVENRYTSGTACRAWHGSLNPSDSYVPLIIAYPGGNRYEVEPIINRDTICPQNRCEGNWKVKDIILEAIIKQYSSN